MLSSNLTKGHRIKVCLSTPNDNAVQQSVKNIFKTLAPSSTTPTPQSKAKLVQESVKTVLKQFSRFSNNFLQSAVMSTCPKCSTRLIHPPALASLQQRFPALTVDSTFDRAQPRCQHCDEMLAHRLATEAELPPPGYTNPITKLEQTIKKLKSLLADVEDEGYESTLISMHDDMQQKWANMVKKRDADIKEAWKPYWAIWGVTKGQDVYSKT